MTTTAIAGPRPRRPAAPERNVFLALIALIWLGILMGFAPEVAANLKPGAAPLLPVIHIHAAIFVGWLVLLTTQILLIRNHRPDLHRRLGMLMVGWAALMLVAGPAAAIMDDAREYAATGASPAFMSVQLTEIVAFAGLTGTGFLLRRHAATHKRLMILATLDLSVAGYSRWLGDAIGGLLGHGAWWQFAAHLYAPTDALILGLGVYDLIAHRRLYPAYLIAVACIALEQAAATGLYYSPAWKGVAMTLIGR